MDFLPRSLEKFLGFQPLGLEGSLTGPDPRATMEKTVSPFGAILCATEVSL